MADSKKKLAVRAALKSIQEGPLDGRTEQARALAATRQALETNPEEALKGLLRSNISNMVLVQREIAKELQNTPLIEQGKGKLSPLISKDWLSLQKALTGSIGMLAQMEGVLRGRWKRTNNEAERLGRFVRNDIADLILDAETTQGGDGADRG